MSKKMKVTKLWQYFIGCSVRYKDHGNDRRNSDETHEGVFIAKGDFAKMRRAWRLVQKLAKVYTNCRCGGCWNCEARRIVGK